MTEMHRRMRGTSAYPTLGRVRKTEPVKAPPRVITDKASRQGTETGGTGIVTIDFGSPNIGTEWEIDRAVVQTTSATDTTVKVYTGADNIPQRVEDLTTAGNGNVADNARPIHVGEGEQLRFVFTGASAGAIATVRLQRRIRSS